jgi:hypothetical protein
MKSPGRTEATDIENEQAKVETESWQSVCDETAAAHVAILKAVHRLESGILLARADAAHQYWRDVVGRELSDLIGYFEKHSATSELPSGLIGQVESVSGHSEQVTAVIEIHRRVLRSARALLQSLGDAKSLEPFSLEKREVARLTAALREHEAREIDLIYETNSRVTGGEG